MSNAPPPPEWIGEVRRKLASDNIERAFEASISLINWVLTSTALAHSTALIAAFNSDRLGRALFAGPAWFFIAGVALSVASGLTLALGAAKLAGEMSEALWSGEELSAEEQGPYDPAANKAILCGSVFLGLSVAAFILGVAYSGLRIVDVPTNGRAEVNQHR